MPPVARALLTLVPTLVGLALVWIGLGIEAGPAAALIFAGLSFIPGLIGVVIGLGRRREIKKAPPTPTEERERARETYKSLRWSPVMLAIFAPFIAILIVYELGLSVGTGLIVGGIAILVVRGLPAERRMLQELRSKAALD